MSQIQSFFISSYQSASQCDDLNHFLRSHRIIRMSQGFVPSGENPGFHILVEYAENISADGSKSRRVDYRAMLKEESQKNLFDKLKNFRSELCKKDNLIGAYMICKDEHLYNMVVNPDITLDDIMAFPHSANIKLDEYGKILFDELVRLRKDEADKIPF